jgi:hypothetical protein
MIILLQIVNRERTIKYQYNPIHNTKQIIFFSFMRAIIFLLKNPTKITHHSGIPYPLTPGT